MNRYFSLKFAIFFIFSVFIIVHTPNVFANENLYVSKEIAENNIVKQRQLEKISLLDDGCTSSISENFHHVSSIRYVDQISPTFDIGFYKNEKPFSIDSTSFEKSDFIDKSKTVNVIHEEPTTFKILLFENRGPQNIQNVTLYFDLENELSKEHMPYLTLIKNPPPPVSDPIFYYIKGQIEEDFGQSYRYGEPWASYSMKSNDPNNLFANASATFSKQNNKLESTFEVSFSKIIQSSNLILTSFDVRDNSMTCYILDAFSVVPKNQSIPVWFEQNILWNKQGKISDETLEHSLQYLISESESKQ